VETAPSSLSSLSGRVTLLATTTPQASQQIGKRQPVVLGKRVGQHRRLIEAAPPLPAPVQRYWHYTIGLGQMWYCRYQQMRQWPLQVQAAVMLPAVNHPADRGLIEQRRLHSQVGRRVIQTASAQRRQFVISRGWLTGEREGAAAQDHGRGAGHVMKAAGAEGARRRGLGTAGAAESRVQVNK
jgi:hypothetical protein